MVQDVKMGTSPIGKDLEAFDRIEKIYAKYGSDFLNSKQHLQAKKAVFNHILDKNKNANGPEDVVHKQFLKGLVKSLDKQITPNVGLRTLKSGLVLGLNILRIGWELTKGVGNVLVRGGDAFMNLGRTGQQPSLAYSTSAQQSAVAENSRQAALNFRGPSKTLVPAKQATGKTNNLPGENKKITQMQGTTTAKAVISNNSKKKMRVQVPASKGKGVGTSRSRS